MPNYTELPPDDWVIIPSEDDNYYTQWEVVNNSDFKSNFEPPFWKQQTYADVVGNSTTFRPTREHQTISPQPKISTPSRSERRRSLSPLAAEEISERTRRMRDFDNSIRSRTRLDKLVKRMYGETYSFSDPNLFNNQYDYKVSIEGRKEPVELFVTKNKIWKDRNHLRHPCWCKSASRFSKRSEKGWNRDVREYVDEVTRTLDYCY